MSRHGSRKSQDLGSSRHRRDDEKISRSRKDTSPTLESPSERQSKHSILSPRSSRKSRGGRRRSRESDGSYISSRKHSSGKSGRRKSGRSPSLSRSPSPQRKPRRQQSEVLHSHSETPSPPPPGKLRRYKSDGYREYRKDRRKSRYAGDDDSVDLQNDDHGRDSKRSHRSSRRSRAVSRRHYSRRSESNSPSRRKGRSRRDPDRRSRGSGYYDRERDDHDDDRRYYEEKENDRRRSTGRSRRDRRRRDSSSSYSIEEEDDRRRDRDRDRDRSPRRKSRGGSGSRRRRRSHRRPKRRHSSSPSVPSDRDERPRQESPMEVAPRAGVVSEEEDVQPTPPPPPPAEKTKKSGSSKTADKPKDSKEKSKEKSKRSSSQHNDDVGHYQGTKGSIMNEKYSVIREVGVGTFGRVLECDDLSKNDEHKKQRRRPQESDTVAIKVVRNIKRYYKSAKIEAGILHDVNRRGGRGLSHCVIMHEEFSFDGHYCMVFESLGSSLYDFMKRQRYQPYPPDIVYDFSKQLLETLEFIHGFKLIHTDLKPENILLMNDREVKRNGYWIPESTRIKVIDFGGATYDNEKKSSIVNTRQYRAPEVILGTGWSMESDMWSAGCILAELYQGELLFATHDNVEHLALIERVIDRFPRWMTERGKQEELIREAFHSDGTHKMERVLEPESMSYVKRIRTLESIVYPEDAWFLNLLRRILVIDPNRRSTARECLNNSKMWTR